MRMRIGLYLLTALLLSCTEQYQSASSKEYSPRVREYQRIYEEMIALVLESEELVTKAENGDENAVKRLGELELKAFELQGRGEDLQKKMSSEESNDCVEIEERLSKRIND